MKYIICNRPPGVYPKMIPIADFCALVAYYMKKNGNDVLMLFTHRNPSEAEREWLSENNLKWRVWANTHNFKKSFRYFIKLYKILTEEKPDVVEFHEASVPLGMITSKLLGIKHRIVWNYSLFIREKLNLPQKMKMAVQNYRAKTYFKLSTNIITNSDAIKKDIIKNYGINPDKVTTMYLGIYFPEHSISKSGEKKFDIICISRYVKTKGQEILIKALPKVVSQYTDLKVVLVGAGDPGSFIDLAKKLNVYGNCQFIGEVSKEDIFSYLNSASISVFPTLVEGFGLVALDSLTCGIPVIASKTGGLVEIIEDNKSGILVDPGNVEQLENAILNLLGNEKLRKELSENGIERSKYFDIHERAKAYANWLTENFTIKNFPIKKL